MKQINDAIVSSVDRTTLLSRQLLTHAARGEVNEAIQRLLESLLGGEAREIEAAGERVAMGETSGVDTMVGLLLGLQIGLEMKG